jgi:cyanophycinase-like exopeptidase
MRSTSTSLWNADASRFRIFSMSKSSETLGVDEDEEAVAFTDISARLLSTRSVRVVASSLVSKSSPMHVLSEAALFSVHLTLKFECRF